MTEGLENSEIYQHIPLRRMGEAEDIATVIKFLAEDATYVTGQVIGVDGGLVV
jgi:NAD(P)-dependent dehydrogenase (short-subunit alcohol dehydrogenase family)